ncbi:hypothetical protein CN918_30635 [Priestia megaterium]|nr:hypothetical protein CN918_30635 [Priestia megaterium]
MNYFGMSKELVENAILHHVTSKSPDYMVQPVNGRFLKRPYGMVYRARGLGSVEMKTIPDLSLDKLNSEACMQYMVRAFDNKTKQDLTYLLLSYDEDDDEREQGMRSNVAQDFVKRTRNWSKQQVKTLVTQYKQDRELVK